MQHRKGIKGRKGEEPMNEETIVHCCWQRGGSRKGETTNWVPGSVRGVEEGGGSVGWETSPLECLRGFGMFHKGVDSRTRWGQQ